MSRSLVFLLSPLFTMGLVYAFGFGAVIACFVLALLSLVLSTGDSEDGTSKGSRSGHAARAIVAAEI